MRTAGDLKGHTCTCELVSCLVANIQNAGEALWWMAKSGAVTVKVSRVAAFEGRVFTRGRPSERARVRNALARIAWRLYMF